MEMFDAIIPALPDAGYHQGYLKGRFCRKDPRAGVPLACADAADIQIPADHEGIQGRHGKEALGYDDATFVEHLGKKVKVIEGSPYNMKITTPEDLTIARGLLSQLKGNL